MTIPIKVRDVSLGAPALSRYFTRYDWLALSIVAILGLIHLPMPFHNDQALFTIGALQLKQGAVLYRDFWDYKPPGVFIFYGLAGSLFGFTEVGIHTFELLYQLLFAVILIVTLKPYYQLPIVASFTPVLTIGLYYSAITFYQMTEVEGLVGLPLFLCLWFVNPINLSQHLSARWLILSGLMGGVVLSFKFVFLPILIALWGLALAWQIFGKPQAWFNLFLRFSALIGIGVAIPILPMLIYFMHLGLADILYRTFIGYPSRFFAEVSYGGLTQFQIGFTWFIQNFAPAIALAIVGIYATLVKRVDFLTLSLVLWFGCGFGLVLMQKTGWWSYYYLVLIVPIGLLAAKGIEVLWLAIAGQTRGHSWLKLLILVSSLLLMFGTALNQLANITYVLVRSRLALTLASRTQFQAAINPEYRGNIEEIAFLMQPDSLPGPIYVIGPPLMYLQSGRPQAIAHQGMAPRSFLPEQWVLINQQLAQARPPYIYIKSNYAELATPKILPLLDRDYIQRPGLFGTWYVIKNPPIVPAFK